MKPVRVDLVGSQFNRPRLVPRAGQTLLRHSPLLLLVTFLCATHLLPLNSNAEPNRKLQQHVPTGFTIEKVAGEPDIVFPMFAAFDDRGRLFVAESSGLDLYAELTALTRKCRISLLEDRDGDGRFEKAQVFADKLVFPMGLVWRNGKLFIADPPDLITLEDTDGDGRADQRRAILTGFGHKDNGSLHGLTFGPDGLLYLTMGSPDGYRLKRADGSILEGESGALLRSRPDGSEPEVLCRGFENLVEVVFTPRGDVIGTDNWFQKPSGGIRDALVHLIEGGLYPMHRDKGTPQPITGEPLPAVSLYPAVALSGLTLYRGQAFPKEMLGNLFSAQHNSRRVDRHILIQEGSTFRTQDESFVTSDDPDFHPSDVLEDADGSLLIVDTGGWYVQHCPTGQIRNSRAPGSIYRVRRVGAARIADPWGLAINWKDAKIERLVELLCDHRPMVRDRAQETLSLRGEAAIGALGKLLLSDASLPARQHALWALAAIDTEAALAPRRRALQDSSADIVITAARTLAVRRDRQSAGPLGKLLNRPELPVRLAAAQALATCGDRSSVPPVVEALTSLTDPHLEHALVHVLHRLAEGGTLLALLNHQHPRVQKAALILLDQPPRPRDLLHRDEVVQRVGAADSPLRRTALRVLTNHPEWAEHAMGLVKDWLGKPARSAEEQTSLGSLILAFQKQPSLQEAVGTALAHREEKMPSARRVFLMQTMAQTELPKLPVSWVEALSRTLQDDDKVVRTEVVRTIAVLQLSQFDEQLAQLAESRDSPAELRLLALRALAPRRPKLARTSFDWLVAQLAEDSNPLDCLAAAEILGKAHLTDGQLRRLLPAVRGNALISPSVLRVAFQYASTAETTAILLGYLEESLRGGWVLSERELAAILQQLPKESQPGADALRDLIRKRDEHQRARLAELGALLTGGQRERGRAVFFGKKVACSSCHRIGSEGGLIGPDLTRIGTVRSDRDLLESIVLPSSTFAQGYESYAVETKDGRLHSGVIATQSADTLVLREASGSEVRLRRDQVAEMKRQPVSLMPQGLPQAMTEDEFRDLLAFLKSLK